MSPWLKQDDAKGEDRMTRRLLRSGKAGSGLAAFGLHSLALLHCAKYLTDGFVEDEFVEETLDAAGVRGKARGGLVDALISGGQWVRASGGFELPEYLEHNPSRDEVLSRRAKDAARKLAGRTTQSERSPHGIHAESARTQHGFRNGSESGQVGVQPSRPVPSRPVTQEGPK